ncbi:hypothetical protein ABHD89_001576 [Salinicoccus halitifaciens]|uniref:Uncharacterized protein n=1 Tax=Salinicoccus halitifaciens TaxID=1073415 RepID=A0ABV2E9U2_9STAP
MQNPNVSGFAFFIHENVFIEFRSLFIYRFMYNYNHYVVQEW